MEICIETAVYGVLIALAFGIAWLSNAVLLLRNRDEQLQCHINTLECELEEMKKQSEPQSEDCKST